MLPKSISKLMLFLSGKKVKINIIYIMSQIIDDIAVIIIKEIVVSIKILPEKIAKSVYIVTNDAA